MRTRKWTNTQIDELIGKLGEQYALPPARSAALEARIHRDVLARFGSFDVPIPAVVHTAAVRPRGILYLLRPRIAFALAGVVSVAIGAHLAVRDRMVGGAPPAIPSVVAVLPTAPPDALTSPTPVVVGSGRVVSVFVSDVSSSTSAVRRPTPATRRTQRTRPLNPTPGVFSSWGTNVFDEEEVLKADRPGKHVLNG